MVGMALLLGKLKPRENQIHPKQHGMGVGDLRSLKKSF